MCRSRRELSNEYLLAKIGVDTAANEPLEVWGENSIQYSFASLLAAPHPLDRRQLAEIFTAAVDLWALTPLSIGGGAFLEKQLSVLLSTKSSSEKALSNRDE